MSILRHLGLIFDYILKTQTQTQKLKNVYTQTQNPNPNNQEIFEFSLFFNFFRFFANKKNYFLSMELSINFVFFCNF